MASLDDPTATLHHWHVADDIHDVEVALPSAAKAGMVEAVLAVDEELQPTKVTKSFAVEGPVLRVSFVACDPKVLRVALSSFYDMLAVALRTLREFDDDGEDGGGSGVQ